MEAAWNGKLKADVRRAANNQIYKATSGIQPSVDLSAVDAILTSHGMLMLDVDGTPLQAFFCGAEGRATIDLGYMKYDPKTDQTVYQGITNSVLVLSWYRYPTGRYDINCYLS